MTRLIVLAMRMVAMGGCRNTILHNFQVFFGNIRHDINRFGGPEQGDQGTVWIEPEVPVVRYNMHR